MAGEKRAEKVWEETKGNGKTSAKKERIMSEAIRKLYRKKGVKPPDGKGIHTKKFHDIATSIKRDNPSYPMSRCYTIAMGKLGRNKAVKKSHRSKLYRRKK